MQDKYDFLGFLKKLKNVQSKHVIIMGYVCVRNMKYSNKFDALNGRVLGR